ncbi:MAG: thioesterase [Endomicrobia bacterium]|nr:thioesterase [Endomicrobiia bacterium]MCL2507512.1 thioesterase [Endomicrobiia bacterium]
MITENFKVRYSEVTPENFVPVWVLQNYGQQAAGIDAQSFNLGWEDLSKSKIAWILMKMSFKILCDIKAMDNIKLNTWHVLSDKLKSRRDFVFFDENGKEAAKAVSWWLVFDQEKRRLTRTPASLLLPYDNVETAMEDIEVSQPSFEGQTPVKEHEVIARIEDTDLNDHVNNVHFTAWAVEGVPEDIRKTARLTDITINFKNEVKPGEKIKVNTYKTDSGFWHILVRETDKKEIASAYSVWKTADNN